MPFRQSAIAALIGVLLAVGPIGPMAGGTAQAGSFRPTVEFLRPSGGVEVGRTIPYGAIRVRAYDRDVGTTDGDGIRRVRVTVLDATTGEVVRRKSERWRPYEYGFVLKPGRYIMKARAWSTNGAGGEWAQTKISITIDGNRKSLTKPRSVVRRERAAAASLKALNNLRANVGAKPVKMNRAMSDRAYRWSLEMSRSGFRHSSSGYAENVAWHSDNGMTAKQAANRFHAMWRNSSGHYANMTNRGHVRVGIGLYRRSNGWWATHIFE